VTDLVDTLIARHGADAVLAAMQPQISDERRERIERVLAARLGSLTVVLEDLYDPHNGAAAIRSVEAVGLQSLHAVESRQPFEFSKKVTIGCHKWVTVHRHPDFATCAAALRGQGMRLLAAVPDAPQSLHELDMAQPAALVFGNEHDGLTAGAVAACDASFSIPMSGFTESLNLSVSVAVSVHTLAARRRTALGGAGDLSEQERAYLRARWYALGTRGVQGIVERFVSERTRAGVGGQTRTGGKP
jgi:tRNA (guanosine-2'-O-)-methyltransferase